VLPEEVIIPNFKITEEETRLREGQYCRRGTREKEEGGKGITNFLEEGFGVILFTE